MSGFLLISPGCAVSRADGGERWIVLSALSPVQQLLSVRQEQRTIGSVFRQGANVCEAIFICSSFPLRVLDSSDRSVTLNLNIWDNQ